MVLDYQLITNIHTIYQQSSGQQHEFYIIIWLLWYSKQWDKIRAGKKIKISDALSVTIPVRDGNLKQIDYLINAPEQKLKTGQKAYPDFISQSNNKCKVTITIKTIDARLSSPLWPTYYSPQNSSTHLEKMKLLDLLAS